MYPPQTLTVLERTTTDDGVGGTDEGWAETYTIEGYIDLQSGTDQPSGGNKVNNAFVEESTHIAIVTKWEQKPTDINRIVDKDSRLYEVTYADDIVGVGHHLELYLKYIGGVGVQ